MELFETLSTALSAYRYIVWPLLGLMALVIVIMNWWNEVKYFLLNVACSFPLFGFVARAARRAQVEDREEGSATTWYKTERELCTKYFRFYERVNKDAAFYDKCANYLNKVEERGRKPTGMVLWVASIFLVILEAFIFALVLSPFIATNISANQAEFSAIVISLLIGTILVPATHLMGAEIHKNGLISKARLWHMQAKRDNDAQKLQSDSRIDLDATYLDDGQPKYLHIVNRVQHNAMVTPTWWKTIIAICLISIFAVGAYLIRSSTINEMETQQVNASPFSQDSASPFSAAGNSPFELPEEAAADGQQADDRAASEVAGDRIFAYKLTFIILSVIFVGVQIIGVLIGVFRSFAGTQSKEASGYITGFSSAGEFAAHHELKREQVARDAEAQLSSLQERIEHRHALGASTDRGSRRSFALYVREAEQARARSQAENESKRLQESQRAEQAELDKLRREVALKREREAILAGAEPPAVAAPAAAVAPAAAPVAEVAEVAAEPVDAEQQANLIASLGDLTQYSESELNSIAAELGVDPLVLLSKQKVQVAIKRAKAGV
ncbi:conserved membrane hypothetical protein [Pseudomonas sp. 8Z]|uniref:hypothetical protein n=1 Tax=Pseudomonas sp. 8Z TaxID=2653166 RepID=UPI0012F390BE|nr:hypothetical protein [Pseudomonas sp. 8Z]VXC96200.1 conserved membrane hypothetical protein [Pseudomonas sp. 8Z]